MNQVEYEAAQQKLARRRALADQMAASGMQPYSPQMVSGRVVKQSPIAALMPLLQGLTGAYTGRKVDQEQKDLETERGADITKAIEAYTKAAPEAKQGALGDLASQTMAPADYAKLQVAQAMKPQPEIIRDLDPTKYTAESLQKFSGSRNYADLVPAPADQSPSGASMSPLLQAYNIAKSQGYNKPILEFAQEFAANQAQYPYAVVEMNGVKTLVDRTTGVPVYGQKPPGPMPVAPPAAAPPGAVPPPNAAMPAPIQYTAPGTAPRTQALTSLGQEAAAGSELKRQEAAGGALGKAQGEIAGGIQTKGSNADVVTGMLDEADKLVDTATGSAGGALIDTGAALFGKANEGSKAIAKLKVLQSGLMLNAPRMEGPQSDRDVQLYREAAGQIGDPSVPREIKKAALATVRAIQQKYQQRAASVNAPGAVGVPARGAPKPMTATGPNGQKLMLQNGQWVPVSG